MYPVSVLTHMLNILVTFDMGVTIWYQSMSIHIVPWAIKNTIQVVRSFESRIFILIVILVELDQFDLNMTVREKCPENEEVVAGQELIGMLKRMSILMLTCGPK